MNYKNGLKIINELTSAGGIGGVFGYGGNTTGDHGGDVGNTDFYAAGDARVPKVIGAGGNDPYEFVKKGKKKKHKKNKSDMPIYRRTFIESLKTGEEYILDCVIYTKNEEYHKIISDILEKKEISYIIEDGCILISGTDRYLQAVLENIQQIITISPFETGDIVALMCEGYEQ